MHIDITIEHEAWKEALPDADILVRRICKTVLSSGALPEPLDDSAEISIVLADDKMIQNLNLQYRGKNTPTNVLSFPATEMHEGILQHESGIPLHTLGDIILSLDTLIYEANDQKKSLHDHFCHLLIHGILHLLGYDHMTKAEAQTMESQEISILKQIGIDNPYLLKQNIEANKESIL